MPLSPQILEPMGEKYALIVGIDNFRDGNIPALRYAKNDALALRDLLTHAEYGKFHRENVHVLLDQEATLGDIRSQFVYWLATKAQEKDHVWIYFAGHGTTALLDSSHSDRPFTNYFLTHDTNPDDLPISALSLEQLEEWLALLTAGRVILLFDCGFSGIGKGRSWPASKSASYDDYAFFNSFAQNDRCLALVATGPLETACEDDDAEMGLFTRILVHRLRLAMSANQDHDLTWEMLQQYLTAEVSRQAELRGVAQTPTRFGGLIGRLSLFGDVSLARSAASGSAQSPADDRAQLLLREAQQELSEDHYYHARELLLEILELDPGNRRALNGLRRIDEQLQKNDRDLQIEHAFSEARRYWDEHNYAEATRWYGKVLELDPTSESARVGVETCRAMLQKSKTAPELVSAPAIDSGSTVPEAPPAWEKPLHVPKIKAYDQFIWPYIGWWALVGAVWGLFGTQPEDPSTAATFVDVVFFAFIGSLIGLVHASAVYFYKLAELRVKAKKLKKT